MGCSESNTLQLCCLFAPRFVFFFFFLTQSSQFFNVFFDMKTNMDKNTICVACQDFSSVKQASANASTLEQDNFKKNASEFLSS